MHYLRTNVLSKQEKELLEAAMEGASTPHHIRPGKAAARHDAAKAIAAATADEHDTIAARQVLCQLQFGQHTRPARLRHDALSCIYEGPQEGPVRDAVSGRRRLVGRCNRHRQVPSSFDDRVRAGAAPKDSWRRAAGHCVSSVALVGSPRVQRAAKNSKMSQRKFRHQCLLQSGALESTVSAR